MLTSEQKGLIELLRGQNKGYKEIADILGTTKSIIKGYCYRNGLTGFKGYTKSHEEYKQEFIDKFESKYQNFEYVSGYTNGDSSFLSRCRVCGHVQQRNAQCVKESNKRQLRCAECISTAQMQKNKKMMWERKYAKALKIRLKAMQRILPAINCSECGEMFTPNKKSDKYCSLKCKKSATNRRHEIARRHRLRENGSIDHSISLKKLYARDQGICHICGEMCNNDDFVIKDEVYIVGDTYPSIDHLMPVSKGGVHSWENIKLAHMRCNAIKGNCLNFKID